VIPAADQKRIDPPWGYVDLALFVSAILPSLALAALLSRVSRFLVPWFFAGNEAATTLAFQLFVYVFLLGALFMVIAWKDEQPFWASISWTMKFRGAFGFVFVGPILAIAVSVLGVLLRAPEVDNPIQRMITGRSSFGVVVVFGALLAPFFEEMVFRGFMLPLFARTFGRLMGVLLTTVPFALLHGAQNQWAWQQLTLIALAGIVFGYARLLSGSTAAAFLVHASYNATQFLALFLAAPF